MFSTVGEKYFEKIRKRKMAPGRVPPPTSGNSFWNILKSSQIIWKRYSDNLLHTLFCAREWRPSEMGNLTRDIFV